MKEKNIRKKSKVLGKEYVILLFLCEFRNLTFHDLAKSTALAEKIPDSRWGNQKATEVYLAKNRIGGKRLADEMRSYRFNAINLILKNLKKPLKLETDKPIRDALRRLESQSMIEKRKITINKKGKKDKKYSWSVKQDKEAFFKILELMYEQNKIKEFMLTGYYFDYRYYLSDNIQKIFPDLFKTEKDCTSARYNLETPLLISPSLVMILSGLKQVYYHEYQRMICTNYELGSKEFLRMVALCNCLYDIQEGTSAQMKFAGVHIWHLFHTLFIWDIMKGYKKRKKRMEKEYDELCRRYPKLKELHEFEYEFNAYLPIAKDTELKKTGKPTSLR